MAMYKAPGNVFTFNGMLNFEGLTIERGELSPGIWGEGYIDRRHPHTYLHEAVVSAQTPREVLGGTASLTFGKGFASFGTDDPMVRPFIKYPVNHHLAQILERVVLIGAIRRGPLTAEYSRFNGDEPQSPSDAPNLERFGDSWAVRATLHLNAAEIQSSMARVVSPENASGGGQDQRKVSVAAPERSIASASIAPFVELSAAHPVATIPNSVFDPRKYYGAGTLWSLSAGFRFAAGHAHSRMGRYGVSSLH